MRGGEKEKKRNTKHPARSSPAHLGTPFPGAARRPPAQPGSSRQPLARPSRTRGLRRATWPSSSEDPGAAAPGRAPGGALAPGLAGTAGPAAGCCPGPLLCDHLHVLAGDLGSGWRRDLPPCTVPPRFPRAAHAPGETPSSGRALGRPRRAGHPNRDRRGSASAPSPARRAFQAGSRGLGPRGGARVRLGRSAASAPSRGLRTRRSSPGRLRHGRSGPAGRGLGAEPARTRAGPGPRRRSLPPVPAHPLGRFCASTPQPPHTLNGHPGLASTDLPLEALGLNINQPEL